VPTLAPIEQRGPGVPTTDELLAQVPLFKDLSKKHLQKVSSLATRIDGQPGKVLTTEGEIGREFIVILEGDVEIRRGDEVLATRGAGDYIGEISLIDHRPRTATVVAKTPVTLEVIDTRAFNTLLGDEPEIAEKIQATAKERLAELEAAEH
jgi:CRP-like cAMP-binding protein